MGVKEKLKNFWYYYKFHVLAAAFVLFLAVLLIVQAARRVEPDLTVYVLTRDPLAFSEGTCADIADRVALYTEDYNNDGTVKVVVKPYTLGEEYDTDDRDRFYTEYVGGGAMLILSDAYGIDYLCAQSWQGTNVSELTDDTSFDGVAWRVNGSPFADCSAFQYISYDVFFTLRRFNDRSWIRIIPGKTREFENARETLLRIVSGTPCEVKP